MGHLDGLSELLSKNMGVFVSALNHGQEPKGVCRLPSLWGSIRGQLLCSALSEERPAVPRTWRVDGIFCFFDEASTALCDPHKKDLQQFRTTSQVCPLG